jgi:DNA-binding FrmR family transcriptional regulator
MTNGSQVGGHPAISASESRDQFAILMQGLSNIMGVLSALNQKVDKSMGILADVTTQITAINTALDANAAASTTGVAALKAAVDTALADLAAAGAAGQSAVIDTIVASLKDTMTKINTLEAADAAQLDAIKTAIMTAIKAVPVPGAPPPAAA